MLYVVFWLNASTDRSFRKARIRGVQETLERPATVEGTYVGSIWNVVAFCLPSTLRSLKSSIFNTVCLCVSWLTDGVQEQRSGQQRKLQQLRAASRTARDRYMICEQFCSIEIFHQVCIAHFLQLHCLYAVTRCRYFISKNNSNKKSL